METNLKLVRNDFSSKSTIGELFIEGERECFTLEDVVRADGVKVYGETAIPYGRYEVIINYSNRFKRQLPRLLNVPMFDGILIHPGNAAKDTHGCILVGETKQKDFIGNSRNAFDKLFKKLQAASAKGKIFIEIVKG
jgi:hypothetical protein